MVSYNREPVRKRVTPSKIIVETKSNRAAAWKVQQYPIEYFEEPSLHDLKL
jgi:hypothetical protein